MLRVSSYVIFVFYVLLLALHVEAIHELPLQIYSPQKAAVLYFPTPAVMRCLNHSNIPRVKRKVDVTREIRIPGENTINQAIKIDVEEYSKNFVFEGVTKQGSKPVSVKVTGGPFFNINEGGQVKPSFLFGLEDLIGVQRKIRVKDKVGDQILDYETFLKRTRGKVGKLKYDLELFGQDRSVGGEIKYFLDGKGKIGDHKITVEARELEKDRYLVKEEYEPIKVVTKVKVYD